MIFAQPERQEKRGHEDDHENMIHIDAVTDPAQDHTIVEVGCGRGFNLRFLAEKYKGFQFVGVDLTEKNVRAAQGQLKGIANASVAVGDFQDLRRFADASVQMVFAIETLCHATDLNKALSEISRILVPGGKLLVFDGFRSGDGQIGPDMNRALRYVEKAMAVNRFWQTEEFTRVAEQSGLTPIYAQDRSREIMPNLIRFSDMAKGFFKVGPLHRIMMFLVPQELVTNAIAGLLMAITVESGAHRYIKLLFEKIKP